MALIYQRSLFSWKDINELGDLERLQLVIDNIPDHKLLETLQQLRGRGRNDYPLAAIWNSLLAGIVFQHKSIESLRRELQRNAQLRELCGFEPLKGATAVPSKSAYNRFITNIIKNKTLIDAIFDDLVKQLQKILPNFGEDLAFDSKAIASLGQRPGNYENDKRGEHDADWGKKTYRGIREDGTAWEKVKSWFGFKLHLIVDANYELPVAMEVTKASQADSVEIKEMFEKMHGKHPELLKACKNGIGDKGYDDTALITKLWDKYGIKPVIDIRNMWKDGEKTRSFEEGRNKYKNITYDYKGTIFCHCPKTGEVRKMKFGGFEKDRGVLKFLCPALQYGIECKGAAQCPVRQGIRIAMEEDRRLFTPVARSSYKWKTIYNKRSSVERVNSRIEISFGFESHYIRGMTKMKVRCGLALCVMLAMALGRAKQNQHELMRSLVKAA
jgi:Transposase DDE domain/Transposase domain (DUF772)